MSVRVCTRYPGLARIHVVHPCTGCAAHITSFFQDVHDRISFTRVPLVLGVRVHKLPIRFLYIQCARVRVLISNFVFYSDTARLFYCRYLYGARTRAGALTNNMRTFNCLMKKWN
jgi:hypothetical protein